MYDDDMPQRAEDLAQTVHPSGRLTSLQIMYLADRLVYTCLDVEGVLERIGLDPSCYDISEVENDLLDASIKRCEQCDWWCEIGELVDEDNNPGPCEDCRR
jgi:hypothetical protein